MCLSPRLRESEGRSEPASVRHSPVTRDYPSRALSGVFQASCAATVLSRNEDETAGPRGKMKPLFLTIASRLKAVNNLGAKKFTGYSPRPRCARRNVEP